MTIPSATVVLGRIEMEHGRLLGARRALQRLAADLPVFADKTVAIIVSSLDRTESDLDRLANRVRRRGATEILLTKLTELQLATDRVARESFALAVGVLARERALDGGACQEADALIAELAALVDQRLARPTVPGEREYLHRAADVIRRRMPDHGLWDLPVVGHEFGHLVVAHLGLYDPVGEQIVELRKIVLGGWDGYTERQSEEFFCDLLATYALGPAFACTMILHRLDPITAAAPGPQRDHPSDPARAAAVLRMVRGLAADEPDLGRYRTTSSRLAQAWETLQEGAPAEARCSEAELGKVHKQVDAMLTLLKDRLNPLRYRWPDEQMLELTRSLEQNRPAASGLTYRIRDVLNAAWLLRLNSWVASNTLPTHVELRARTLIAEIAGKRDP